MDIYVLACIYADNEIRIAGWAARTDLINETNLIDLGRGEGYAMRQDQLNKFPPNPSE